MAKKEFVFNVSHMISYLGMILQITMAQRATSTPKILTVK